MAERTKVDIARDLLCCAVAHEASSRLLGNITAIEIASLAASILAAHEFACPLCGSEPWVNIDCKLCASCSAIEDAEARHA
jgi:hypothetical protein